MTSQGEAQVRLFGCLVFEKHDRQLIRVPSSRCLEILGFLVIRPGEPVSRRWLVETVWPSEEQSVARNRLSVSLFGCRQAFAGAGLNFNDFFDVTSSFLTSRINGIAHEWSIFWNSYHLALGSSDVNVRERAYRELVRTCRAPVLVDIDTSWAAAARIDAQNAFIEAVEWLATFESSRGNDAKARALLAKIDAL